MSNDFLPKSKTGLQLWLNNFVTVAGSNLVPLTLTTTDMTTLTALQSAFNSSVNGVETAKANLKSAVAAETTATKNVTADVRSLVRRIQISQGATPALKEQLGINPRNTPKTRTPPVTPTGLVVDTGGTRNQYADLEPHRQQAQHHFHHRSPRIGNTGPFFQVGSTPRIKFAHTGEKAGTQITYRVIASRSGQGSLPSQEVTVNAPVSAPVLTLSKAA